jgi:hypothetical protein
MNESEHATHRHKRLGEVVMLRSTAELAQVFILGSSERLWVKLTDLNALSENESKPNRAKKRRARKTPSRQVTSGLRP